MYDQQVKNVSMSIGMPVYNGARYLREALNSLINQTYHDFELIISDNASTDGTREICEAYEKQDSRIRYIRQDKNIGALQNFQFVLNRAQGEYFMWAAADDRWDENWIKTIIGKINGRGNVACFGELVHIDEESNILQHVANGSNLKFCGSRLRRKLSFYLTHEQHGTPNLFYAIYPSVKLREIELSRYNYDYVILFHLLDSISYDQVSGPRIYKRIHGGCESYLTSNAKTLNPFLRGAKIIRNDLKRAIHYIRHSDAVMKIILTLLLPIRLLVSMYFRVSRLLFPRLN